MARVVVVETIVITTGERASVVLASLCEGMYEVSIA